MIKQNKFPSSYVFFNHNNINHLHHLCGHANPKKLIAMSRKGTIAGLPTSLSMKDYESCPQCAGGKATKRHCNNKNTSVRETYRDNTIDIADSYLILITQNNIDSTPTTMTEAIEGPNGDKWEEGLKKEFGGIKGLEVCRRLTKEETGEIHRKGTKIFECHCVLKIKYDELGNISRCKVRLVLSGQHMVKGIHFEDTFAPCAGLETLRLITAIATHKGWGIQHADVPNAYLHGRCDRLVFPRLPKYWNRYMGNDLGEDGDIVVLEGTLYGSPPAGRQWNKVTDSFLKENLHFISSVVEPCLYFHYEKGTIIVY